MNLIEPTRSAPDQGFTGQNYLQGGRIVGESDDIALAPKTRPVTCAELCATIYTGLGIDPTTEIPGPHGRPTPITEPNAQPIRELF